MMGCKQQSNMVYQQITLNMNHGTSGTLEVSLDEVSLDTFTRVSTSDSHQMKRKQNEASLDTFTIVSTSDSHQMKRNRMKCHWMKCHLTVV